VVVGVKGGGEKLLDGEILKTTTVGPLQYDDYRCSPIQGTCTIQHGCTVFDNIPRPPVESIDDLTSTNERTNERTNEQIYGPS
jgi:hypothetical protein